MLRRIIQIDKDKCNGCGLCATACHEGAIGMVDGIATLLRDDYCDGLGDCLPACPTGAITFVEREAAPYNEAAVKGGSLLRQWPVQIKLAPFKAPWLQGADLLIAADCTAFAYGNFHRDFIRDHAVLVGCPKLDGVDYSIKLTEIFKQNDIRSIKVVRMEVPCCGGMEFAVRKALDASGKAIPLEVVTISVDGVIL
jgi:NAD-dependent dihydropyrimidine dehydrogenase PreA subunit